jgi:hypothetical protein
MNRTLFQDLCLLVIAVSLALIFLFGTNVVG